MRRNSARVIAELSQGMTRAMGAYVGPPKPPPPPPTRAERVWFALEPWVAGLARVLLVVLAVVCALATVYSVARVAAQGWEAGTSDSAPPAHVRE